VMSTAETVFSIETKRFGLIEVSAERILEFKMPILGFETFLRYVLIEHEPESPFQWLQSVENPELAFVLTQPALFGIPYAITLTEEVAETLKIQQAEDVVVFTLVTVPEENPTQMTANLLGPVVINIHHNLAGQVPLQDPALSTRTPLMPPSNELPGEFISKSQEA
jgi:flagellar assembly factor FliW